jgi:hypothetical protein
VFGHDGEQGFYYNETSREYFFQFFYNYKKIGRQPKATAQFFNNYKKIGRQPKATAQFFYNYKIIKSILTHLPHYQHHFRQNHLPPHQSYLLRNHIPQSGMALGLNLEELT